MTDPEEPLPAAPEVPEEFAAAYREAYRRALELPAAAPEETFRATRAGETGTRRADLAGALATWRESRWFLPVAATATVLLLTGTAYCVGTAFSGEGEPRASVTAAPQASRTTGKARPHAPAQPTTSVTVSAPGGWQGGLEDIDVDAVAADCTAPPGTDAAGRRVSYVPENAVDGRVDTAWRCAGTAVGKKLTLRLSDRADIAEVGLIPGYAKTDPTSGADRYAENNRITRVRWTFGDGESIVQRLDPDPKSRAMQLLRVPRTTTDSVTLEILALRRGPRDATAISEIRLAAAR